MRSVCPSSRPLAKCACWQRDGIALPSRQMFHTRYSLFKQIYSHRATKAIEYMITDAMVEAGECACLCGLPPRVGLVPPLVCSGQTYTGTAASRPPLTSPGSTGN